MSDGAEPNPDAPRSLPDLGDDGHYAAIVEASPDFVGTATADGRILTINRAGRNLIGVAADEDIRGKLLVQFHPQWARNLIQREAIPSAIRDGSWSGETAITTADGREVPLSQVVIAHRDECGTLRYVSTVARDISEQYASQNRLEAEVRVRHVLDSAQSSDDAIPDVLCQLVETLEADWAEFWIPDEARLKLLVSMGSTQAPRGFREWEEVPRKRDSDRFAIASLASQTRDTLVIDSERDPDGRLPNPARAALASPVLAGDRMAGVLILYWDRPRVEAALVGTVRRICRDISESIRRTRAEAAMRDARLAAETASQSKSQFLANMSHEIRTPLTAILGYAEILASTLTDPDNEQLVQTIRRNGQHLLDIINDILDLSRIEAGRVDAKREFVSPTRLALDVGELMTLQAAEQGLRFEVLFGAQLPDRVVSDRVRLRQILVNLTSNAIKFTRQGFVRLRVDLEARDQELCVAFRVEDSGIGMERDELDLMFQPFTQADSSHARAYQGTGLGLTISRRLAAAVGGDLSATSEVGKGSSFYLTIPLGHTGYDLVDTSTLRTETTARPKLQPPSRRLTGRILVVDDRLDIRLLLRHILEGAGARVETASDGREALRAVEEAEEAGQPFGSVVMDMQMPVMDGFVATGELRDRGFAAPIIALTAGALKDDRARALAAGCDAYISKPVQAETLIERIADCQAEPREPSARS